MRHFIGQLIRTNWLKTLYLNFKLFPINTALKLPVIIYGKCRMTLKGKIVFNIPVKRGLLKIGHRYEMFTYKEPVQFRLEGTMIINGEVWLGTSTGIHVGPHAILTMGHLSSLGSKGVIICRKSVTFSDYSRIGYGSTVSDSNYHFIKDIETGAIHPFEKPVHIGIQNYISSNVAVLAGTVTPNNCTVGFGSVCNKDYTATIPENSIIAGVPAKLVKTGVVRIFDFKKEAEIIEYFKSSHENVYYDDPENN